jgi:uncharacterized protein (DUF58 family)
VVAAEAAAIAAWRVLAQGDRVGALVFGDSEIRVIEPLRSEQRVAQILDCVIDKNHALNARSGIAPNPGMLNRALRRASELVRHDSLVCIVSDAAGIDRETTRYVTRLTAHNDVLFAFIYDPLERALPDAGRLTFTDGRTQVELNTAERRLREAYRADFERRLQRMRATSRRHAIPLLAVHTAAPVLDQVRGQLGLVS